jgi:hypothetical protein
MMFSGCSALQVMNALIMYKYVSAHLGLASRSEHCMNTSNSTAMIGFPKGLKSMA